MALIELRDVSYRYSPQAPAALDNITLRVERGEFVGIVGPTGAGKSTLLMTLNGAIPNFHVRGTLAGEVVVDGHTTRKARMADLASRIGTVLQDPESQIFSLYVEDELTWGVQNLGVPRQEIMRRLREVVRWMGLEPLLNRFSYDLSGGEKQKVCLASVLIMQPEILLLDEPTAELDTLGTEMVFDVIARLRERQATVLLVEHKLEYLVRYATRLILMRDGRVVAETTPERLVEHAELLLACGYRLPQVAELFERVNRWSPRRFPVPLTLEEAISYGHSLLEQCGGSGSGPRGDPWAR